MNKFKYFIATLGGFQFGYGIGIMAGAILFIATQFSLTPEQQGTAVSIFLIGAFSGSAIGGPLANRIGRKKTQQVLAIAFLLGTAIIVFAPSLTQIIIGRILQGIAAGGFAVAGPMYLAEVSPPANRGFYVGCYQLSVTLGILIAFAINWALSFSGSWQWMFALGAIPALAHFIGFFFLPDSTPQKKEDGHLAWKTLLDPHVRKALIIVILINVFQQITGVNAILYFAPSIFQASGFVTPSAALLPAVLIGIINFVMTIAATLLLDRWGRRPLLLTGISGMIISLVGMVVAFLSNEVTMKWLATSSIMVYIASFAVGLGPIPQLLGTELFPRSIRGPAMSIGGLSNWIFNFLVVFTFMGFTTKISHAGTFALYAVFGLLALIFIWKYIPETKGRILD
jgi:MFS family permease